jgi:hypothetical protein
MKIGMMVAPGMFFSTAFYTSISGEGQFLICVFTNLDLPPPLPSVNVPMDADGHIGIGVVALRLELEVWCKFMASIYLGNAGNDVAVEEFEGFAINLNLRLMEFGFGTLSWQTVYFRIHLL